METVIPIVRDLVVRYGLNIISAIVILAIGIWLANRLAKWLGHILQRSRLEPSLTNFINNIVYYALLAFVVLAVLDRLGIATTSLVAVIGAAGLAVGLALEGALSNFAAGVLILFFHPFKVADWVEVAGIYGKVESILVFSTQLVNNDNKTIIIPNSQITGAPIVNYSRREVVRLDMTFGIGYKDDIRKTKQLLLEIISAHPLVAKEPAPTVSVRELGDNSVNFAVRPFATPDHYARVWADITEQVKLRFDEESISVPFPQHNVYLHPHSS